MKLGFIGAGNMGGAILSGVLKKKLYSPENIFVVNRRKESSEKLQKKYGINICQSSVELVKNSDIIIIGVKPIMVGSILEEIKDFSAGKIIISIAAAVELADIESILKEQKIVRVMPNTPAAVGYGVSGIVFNKNINDIDKEYVIDIFSAVGSVEIIEEKNIEALTALSGSGPAYVYMFIEALADGAVLNGLARSQAYKLAVDTVIGGAKMIIETKEHPGRLKDNVCSPAGSTIEAVRILEEKNFRSAIIECEKACFNKLKEMAKK